MTASSYLNNDQIAATAQELLVRNKQLQQQVEQLTQERDAAIAETETFRETLVDNEAYGLQVIRERDAAKADAQRLAVVLQRMWDHEHLHPQEYLDKHPDDRIYGDWYQVAVGIHKDAAAALAAHQRGEG